MAETFIEVCPNYIIERKDKSGETLSISAKISYFKTEGPFDGRDEKTVGEYQYYNRTLIETVEVRELPGVDIVSAVETKISAKMEKAALPTTATVFDCPILTAYKK